jgi:hypothetical protein
MSKRKNQRDHKPHRAPHIDGRADAPHDEAPDVDRAPWQTDLSRQQSMAVRSRETRTKRSVGQANTMRLKRGNQPRNG